MKISAFTFLRNAARLQFPFVESIRSALPLVDEYVIALGESDDDTEARIRGIQSDKIRIIHTTWNETLDASHRIKGFVYGQQKSIAMFNCTGDWLLYLEGDELLHEDDIPRIREVMQANLNNPQAEALYFKYTHFYGNPNTVALSPRWYRREVRAIRGNLPIWGMKGLFFSVLVNYKKMRYPKAVFANARIYHYGWVRAEEKFNEKSAEIFPCFTNRPFKKIEYGNIDPSVLHPFTGTHPKAIHGWLPQANGLFQPNPSYKLSGRDKKNRWVLFLEKCLSMDFSRHHFIQVD